MCIRSIEKLKGKNLHTFFDLQGPCDWFVLFADNIVWLDVIDEQWVPAIMD